MKHRAPLGLKLSLLVLAVAILAACGASSNPPPLEDRTAKVWSDIVCQTDACNPAGPIPPLGTQWSTGRFVSGQTNLLLTLPNPTGSGTVQATWQTPHAISSTDGQEIIIGNPSGQQGVVNRYQTIQIANDPFHRCLGVGHNAGVNSADGFQLFTAEFQQGTCALLHVYGSDNSGNPLGGIYATVNGTITYRLHEGNPDYMAGSGVFWEQRTTAQVGIANMVIPLGMRLNFWPTYELTPRLLVTADSAPGLTLGLTSPGAFTQGAYQPNSPTQDWYLTEVGVDPGSRYPVVVMYPSSEETNPSNFAPATIVEDVNGSSYMELQQNQNSVTSLFEAKGFSNDPGTGVGLGTFSGNTCMSVFQSGNTDSLNPSTCSVINSQLLSTQVFGLQVRQ